MSIPAIQTARLRLRAHRADDLNAMTTWWQDPVVTRHIGGKSFSREEIWGKLLRYAGMWPILGFGYWAIEELATGDVIGELGFADFKREIEARFASLPEIGWVLVSTAHGRGYATEAVRAVVAWGDESIDADETMCLISRSNQASIRVAVKTGYIPSDEISYQGTRTLVFRRGVRRAVALREVPQE
jgi:RimJ/RimL family protein N-acetyltransferase